MIGKLNIIFMIALYKNEQFINIQILTKCKEIRVN